MDHYKTIFGYKIISKKDWAAIEQAVLIKDEKLAELQDRISAMQTEIARCRTLKRDLRNIVEHYSL